MENLEKLNVSEIAMSEKKEIEAGTFAHDVGTAIRFLFMSGGNGNNASLAISDYYSNKIMCGC